MAAMSAAPTATTLTPPSSSHGGDPFSWNTSSGGHVDTHSHNNKATALGEYPNGTSRKPPTSHYDNSDAFSSNHGLGPATTKGGRIDPEYNPKATVDSTADAMPGTPETGRPKSELYGANPDSEASKWIHRDKLMRIENEELQAAGYIPPTSKPRARSKVRRDGDRTNGYRSQADSHSETRSRKNSTAVSEPKTPEITIPTWDLRLPEEIMADEPYFATTPGGSRITSRIPVAKLSPVPIPSEHLERDAPMTRRRDESPDADNSLSYQKTRSRSDSMNGLGIDHAPQGKRSVTDSSPKKNVVGVRKGSAPAKTASGGSLGKKTGAGSKEGPSRQTSQSRPTTRSGELSPVGSGRQPEGDPPWMISAYKPDPRLPPDQQLLPTVAKRLQQEKWEKEGKFGNVYDKEFRPLTDEGFLKPPEPAPATERPSSKDGEKQQEEWPLKTEPKSLAPLNLGRTGSYSTIPKIQDKPTMISPIPSPRTPVPRPEPSPLMQPQTQQQQQQQQPQQEDEKEKKGGCGCCIVM